MIVPIAGPWKGIEERGSFQTEKHCELAINVDFSRGFIEPREGTRLLSNSGKVSHGRIAVMERPDGPPYILNVGPSQYYDWRIYCDIHQLDGTLVASVDLTTTFGEEADQHFMCSIQQTIIVNLTDFAPNYIGLITTKNGSYIWNPHKDPATVRRPVMSGPTRDALQELIDIPYYWKSLPRGRICEQHKGRMYYAGFDKQIISLSQAVPESVNAIPSSYFVGSARTDVYIAPHMLWYSDANDPLGLGAGGLFGFSNRGERVTGLKSFKESLVIFSDKAIYVAVGDPEGGQHEIRKVVDGITCIAPHAIEEADGVLFFVGGDGIYAFDGSSAQKISDPINSFWDKRISSNSTIKSGLSDALKTFGYPWRASTTDAQFATSCHVRKRNQIWFSIPSKGGNHPRPRQPICTIVYDYKVGAFTYYVDGSTTTLAVPFMFDGTTYIEENGQERIFLARGGLADGSTKELKTTALVEYGGMEVDLFVTTSPSYALAAWPFLFAWVSCRLLKDNEETLSFRRVRLKMIARNKGTNAATYFLDGEESAFDKKLNGTTNSDRQQASGTIIMHPDTSDDYFLGVGRLGTMILGQQSLFTSRIDPSSVASKWCQFGVAQYTAGTVDPKPATLCIQSYSLEIPDVSRGLR